MTTSALVFNAVLIFFMVRTAPALARASHRMLWTGAFFLFCLLAALALLNHDMAERLVRSTAIAVFNTLLLTFLVRLERRGGMK